MRKTALFLLFLLGFLLSACSSISAPTVPASETAAAAPETTAVPETAAPATTVPETESTVPLAPAVELTDEEKAMLLKLGMAERGSSGCTECIALVMRTVLNRVESGRFNSSIRSVIFAQDQFTPVSDGSYYIAEPNAQCFEALELVISGWDESQGALFYEWLEGESWHSKNLNLLFQHCDTRFYN